MDTSIIIPWLKENYGCEVIAYIANVGQIDGPEEAERKALKTGANRVFVEDLRKEFVVDYLWPLVKSGASYEGSYLLGSSIARPLIARRQIEVALREGADALVHGCEPKGNDQVRFELVYKTFAPQMRIVAPWREWEIQSRREAIAYAKARNIPIRTTEEKIYSHDSNLWHFSHEGGILDDPAEPPPHDIYELTLDPSVCPDGDSEITLDFDSGVPVGLNGCPIPPIQLLEDLNEIAGTNGIGRVDFVENRILGQKSRGVYETPGGTLIMAAHRELEALVLDRQTRRQKDTLAINYAQLVYDGQWFTPLREAMDAFFSKTNENITGSVTLSLYKGNLTVKSRRSRHSLYHQEIPTFGSGETRHQDAEGFIKFSGLKAV